MEKKRINIAISGFGKIGRKAFFQLLEEEEYYLAAVNDLTCIEVITTLMEHEASANGKEVSITKLEDAEILASDFHVPCECLNVNGKRILLFHEMDCSVLPWNTLDIDVVLDCTGFCSGENSYPAKQHLEAGAKKVIASGKNATAIIYDTQKQTLKKNT